MSWVHLSKKRVAIRKPRVCDGCGASFPAGAGLWRTVGIWERDKAPITAYTCDVCEEWIDRQDFHRDDELPFESYPSVDPEGWAQAQEDVIQQAMKEALDAPEHPGTASHVPGTSAVGGAQEGQ